MNLSLVISLSISLSLDIILQKNYLKVLSQDEFSPKLDRLKAERTENKYFSNYNHASIT